MNKKMMVTLVSLILAACGGGGDDPAPTAKTEMQRPPENILCQTTVPQPPDCPLIAK